MTFSPKQQHVIAFHERQGFVVVSSKDMDRVDKVAEKYKETHPTSKVYIVQEVCEVSPRPDEDLLSRGVLGTNPLQEDPAPDAEMERVVTPRTPTFKR